jgi:sulfonate transport system permease protein
VNTIDAPGVLAVSGPERKRRRWWAFVASTALMLALWELASQLAGQNSSHDALVPGIPDVLGATRNLANYWKGGLGVTSTNVGGAITWQGAVLGLGYNVGVTAYHLVFGLVLGVGAGLLLAVAVCWSKTVRSMLALPAHFARMMPLLAMVPLFSLWFGDNARGSILFVAFTAFALVFAIGISAIGNVAGYYAQYARSLGASRARAYGEVILPAALPQLRSGILLAVGFGWSSAIASEYLGSEYGLGHIVQNAEFFGRTNMLALVALIALLLAGATYLATVRLLDWATRWAE